MRHTNLILLVILWISTLVLFLTSVADFGTWAVGINTYAMYFLSACLMLYLLIGMRKNKYLVWGFPLMAVANIVVELLNYIYYDFYPVTHFFYAYMFSFILNGVVALVLIRRKAILFDIRKSQVWLIGLFMLLSILIGYYIQWKS